MTQATVQAKSVDGWSNPCVVPTLALAKAKVALYHAMSPTCWWSWGYYGTLARVRLVYGNQVDMRLAVFPVYENVEHYWHKYGMNPERLEKWAEESQKIMGVPIHTSYRKTGLPRTVLPPTLAVIAAYRQGQPLGDRLGRALARRFCVEGLDATTDEQILDAAQESGLDVDRFRRDLQDEKGLRKEMEAQAHGLPEVPLGFYNLVVADDRGRKIVLDHAFDPADVESAIEYLSGGKLRKNEPSDPGVYLAASGPAPTIELARAFAWTPSEAERRLAHLEKGGRVRRQTLAGAPHWVAA